MRPTRPDLQFVTSQIAKQGEIRPDHFALSARGQRLTYRELCVSADSFAAYLAECGIEHGDTVALCMERSFEWIIAALGIMFAGAAYVPLDVTWPDARLRFALENSASVAIVSRATRIRELQTEVFGIDPFRDAIAIRNSWSPERGFISSESLAYLIYTSGSTGSPKGVEITHGNLEDLARWHRDFFKVGVEDRASHLAGLGFDAAAWEIWPNLAAGAELHLIDDDLRSSPDLIRDWMLREEITIGFVPTVQAEAMMALDWPESTALRSLLIGGETMQAPPPPGLPFAVFNNYGPTECTVVATSCAVSSGSEQQPPIGHPRAGAKVYLLDDSGNEVSGVHGGEIYIGGNCVGRGYRNLPGATSERFFPDPFSEVPGSRMFRTGDRGVRLPDGQIRFLGRLDRQVKIRGYRIELEEIDSVLRQHESVRFATVTVRNGAHGEGQLVAYVLFEEGAPSASAAELRSHLRNRLPRYMVPAVFVRLHQIPLCRNGKIDRSLLPDITDEHHLDSQTEMLGGPLGTRLLASIRSLLGDSSIGKCDNFFLAGGDSLLGTQLLLMLDQEFGVELTFDQIFNAPTVADLAILIEGIQWQEQFDVTLRSQMLQTYPSPDDLFDTGRNETPLVQQRPCFDCAGGTPKDRFSQDRTIDRPADSGGRVDNREPILPPGVLPVGTHRCSGRIFWVHSLNVHVSRALGSEREIIFVVLTAGDIALLGERPTLQSIAACFLQKIRAVQPCGPYILSGLCVGGILAYEIALQLRAAGQDVSLLILLDPPSPSYLRAQLSLIHRLFQPRYLLHRVACLGLRRLVRIVCQKLLAVLSRSFREAGKKSPAQRIVETAAFNYQLGKYDSKVLLLLASQRAPRFDFRPTWQAAINGDLNTEYVDVRHDDLIRLPHVQTIANVLAAHVALSTQ